MAQTKRKRSTYVMTEPHWVQLALIEDNAQREQEWKNIDYFVRYEIADKVLRAAFKTWLRKDSGLTKEEISAILTLSDWNFNHVGKYCFVHSKTGWMTESARNYIDRKLQEFLEKAKTNPKSSWEEDTEDAPAPKPKKVVAMRENLNEAMCFVELGIDEIVDGKNVRSVTALRDFKLNNAEINQMFAELGKYKDEMVELQQVRQLKDPSDWDKQLLEGFSNLKVTTVRKIIEFYDACEGFLMNEKTAKKITRIRKKRPTDKNKLVRRLRYLAEDKDLGIASVNPVAIIGATEVWMYDVKRKRLCVYASEYDGGLSVKGTAIENYSDAKSYEKTIRKPEEMLPAFMKARANGLHKFMDNIRGKKMAVKTRVQPNSVILRIKE
jgi:hypothetical protein